MKNTGGLAIWKQAEPELYFESLFHNKNVGRTEDSNHVDMSVSISE